METILLAGGSFTVTGFPSDFKCQLDHTLNAMKVEFYFWTLRTVFNRLSSSSEGSGASLESFLPLSILVPGRFSFLTALLSHSLPSYGPQIDSLLLSFLLPPSKITPNQTKTKPNYSSFYWYCVNFINSLGQNWQLFDIESFNLRAHAFWFIQILFVFFYSIYNVFHIHLILFLLNLSLFCQL